MRMFHHETISAELRRGSDPPEVDVASASGTATLALPASLGGVPVAGATNPEQLFGSAYAGCMIFAVEYAARRAKLPRSAIEGVRATATVRIGRSAENINRMEVELAVELPSLDQEAAERLCTDAVRFCPFHQAVHGNADATLVVSGRLDAGAVVG